MNTLLQQLAGGSLAQSLARLESRIRTQPGDADLRAAFAQLLCLDANWPRALAQLKSWQALKPQAQPTVTLLEQAIEGERQRGEVMAGRARPVAPVEDYPWLAAMITIFLMVSFLISTALWLSYFFLAARQYTHCQDQITAIHHQSDPAL